MAEFVEERAGLANEVIHNSGGGIPSVCQRTSHAGTIWARPASTDDRRTQGTRSALILGSLGERDRFADCPREGRTAGAGSF
jgi:hypothetical protein